MQRLPVKPSSWQELHRAYAYDNPWISVEAHDVIHPGGSEGHYGVVRFKKYALGVIPLDDELNTWIVGQYRYPLDMYTWEIPEGGGLKSVLPLESIQRELKEETGIEATHWELIQQMQLSNSVTDETALLYVATGLSFGQSNPDEDEDLVVRKIPFLELYERVLSGEIIDSLSVTAVLKLKLMIDAGWRQQE